MRRRLVLVILATTATTLLLAGLGTLLLATREARRDTEAELRRQAEALVGSLADLARQGDGAGPGRPVAVAGALRRALQLEGLGIVLLSPTGTITGDLPEGIGATDLDVGTLQTGTTVSGRKGDLVFAAAAEPSRRVTPAVVLTRTASSGLGSGLRWFVLASGLTLVVAAAVAAWVSTRLIAPVRESDAAARRIAAGDLAARVPEPKGDDELADLARSVNTMAASLERSKRLEQQFLLSVSHDLRTPLTSIRGYAEAIADGADPAWASGVILRESARLERLVRDLLDLARLEARAFSLAVEPVDLAQVARGAVDGLRPEAGDLVLDLDAPAPVMVRGDRDRLAQVIANLVENATRYARRAIRVGCREVGGTAVLWVDDDGPGIAPDDLPHVFERLYVAKHEPARRESGSGLGLAIVRELVQAMGGTVAADVAPGGGARLVVHLPVAGTPLPPPPGEL